MIEADLDDPEAVKRAEKAVHAQHKALMRAKLDRPEIMEAITAEPVNDPTKWGTAGKIEPRVNAWLKKHGHESASLKAIRERLKKLPQTR